MSRPLHFHKPSRAELRTLLSLLETAADPIIRQRATTIVWLSITAIAKVAQILNMHLNTVLYCIRSFNREHLRWITQRKKAGIPVKSRDGSNGRLSRWFNASRQRSDFPMAHGR